MKKFFFLLTAFALASVASFAQNEDEVVPNGKPTVFIEKFTASQNTSYTTSVRNAVLSAIAKVGRVEILDAEAEGVAANEEVRRTSGNISAGDGDMVERLGAVVKLGAQFYVKGNIDAITINKSSSQKDGKTSYKTEAEILLTMKLINPSTGSIIKSKQVKHSKTVNEYNESAAIAGAIENINILFEIEDVVNEFFPIEGQIIDINESKKDEAKSVYINAGSLHGVSDKLKFEVFKVKTVAGREARTKVGELRVAEIQGDDLTLCKVKNGGKEILAEFKAGNKLVIKSRKDNSLIRF